MRETCSALLDHAVVDRRSAPILAEFGHHYFFTPQAYVTFRCDQVSPCRLMMFTNQLRRQIRAVRGRVRVNNDGHVEIPAHGDSSSCVGTDICCSACDNQLFDTGRMQYFPQSCAVEGITNRCSYYSIRIAGPSLIDLTPTTCPWRIPLDGFRARYQVGSKALQRA